MKGMEINFFWISSLAEGLTLVVYLVSLLEAAAGFQASPKIKDRYFYFFFILLLFENKRYFT